MKKKILAGILAAALVMTGTFSGYCVSAAELSDNNSIVEAAAHAGSGENGTGANGENGSSSDSGAGSSDTATNNLEDNSGVSSTDANITDVNSENGSADTASVSGEGTGNGTCASDSDTGSSDTATNNSEDNSGVSSTDANITDANNENGNADTASAYGEGAGNGTGTSDNGAESSRTDNEGDALEPASNSNTDSEGNVLNPASNSTDSGDNIIDPTELGTDSDGDVLNSSEDGTGLEADALNSEKDKNADSEGDALRNAKNRNADGELVSPAFFYETEVDGYGFTLSADKNIVPEGTTARITVLAGEQAQDAREKVQDMTDTCILGCTSFDISLLDENGEELQPEAGKVHVSVRLSEAEARDMEEFGGSTKLQLFHLHEDEEAQNSEEEIEPQITESESDIQLPTDSSREIYVEEKNIDPETHELKGSVDSAVLFAGEPEKAEYLKNITMDFDVDSFSVFMVVNANQYSFDPVTEGNMTTISLTDTEALNKDFRNYVQDAFNVAWTTTKADKNSYYTVKIPAGSYTFKQYNNEKKQGLRIGSNTTFDMGGATIAYGEIDDVMITTKMLDFGEGGYDDYWNITLRNGTLNGDGDTHTMVKLAHMTGLNIQSVTFEKSSAPHMLEIGACKNVTVRSCAFRNTTHTSGELEAFQIDMLHEGSLTYVQDPIYDDFCSENVEVSYCTFSDLNRGFGSHGAVAGNFYHKNVNLHDCTFEDIKNTAIMCSMWKDSKISNNTLNNVGRGIDTSSYSWYTVYPEDEDDTNKDALGYEANLTIESNQIVLGGHDRNSMSFVGIMISGYNGGDGSETVPGGIYATSGFTLQNNTITGFVDDGNTIEDELYADVYSIYSKGITATGNTISHGLFGFLIQGQSQVNMLNANTFHNQVAANLAVRGGATVSDMNGNRLSSDCPYGIYVDDSASCNGSCEYSEYKMGAGEAASTRTEQFSLFTNDLSTKVIADGYVSDNKKISGVTKGGKIKSKAKGKATITASWVRGEGTVSINVAVNVKKAPSKIKNLKNIKLKVGETYQLSPKVNTVCSTFTYSSSKKKVAKVTKTGLIKAKKKGKAEITVTTYNGVEKKFIVKVK